MMHTGSRYLLIVLGGLLLFLPFLGHVHLFDWDEINFAESAREMLLTGDYFRVRINFQPFWEKPPLFIWMQALSMKAFGVNAFAARLPNALTGIATLCALYHVGRKVSGSGLAGWWVILYLVSWLPHFYFKTGIIDPVFNLFIFLGFYQAYQVRFATRRNMHALLAGVFLGLAVMTKGPVAILVAMLALGVYAVMNRGLIGFQIRHLLLIAGGVLLVNGAWMLAVAAVHGWEYFRWFLGEFLSYQVRLLRTEDSGHGGPFYYHFLILLIGCFPASVFLFRYLKRRVPQTESTRDFTRWMWALFWVVLVLFSIVKTKIVHYSSLCYFPLTYLAALQVEQLWMRNVKPVPLVRYGLLLIGGLVAIAVMLLPVAGFYSPKLIPYIRDPFAAANLEAQVPWHITGAIWGLLALAGTCIAVWLMRRDFRRGIIILCIVQILVIQVAMVYFTPRIEAYSQRAAISFFKSMQGKDVYVHVLGYKSYAHYFYTMKQKPGNPQYYNPDGTVNEVWLLTGDIDKPAYFVSKITSAAKYREMPQLTEIGSRNGFVFFERAGQ